MIKITYPLYRCGWCGNKIKANETLKRYKGHHFHTKCYIPFMNERDK